MAADLVTSRTRSAEMTPTRIQRSWQIDRIQGKIGIVRRALEHSLCELEWDMLAKNRNRIAIALRPSRVQPVQQLVSKLTQPFTAAAITTAPIKCVFP